MENYSIEGTPKTPTINFDTEKGHLEIKGRSIPENSIEFYRPLVENLEKYSGGAKPSTNVVIALEYFNTSSSKCILDVFKKLENIHKNGSAVTINWHYEEDDEDMLEAGEDYQAIINVPFKMVQISE
jgi:SiaC family regulatory phosphoprotein